MNHPTPTELRLFGWLLCGIAAIALGMALDVRDGVFFAAGATCGGGVALWAAWAFDRSRQ